ncbi:MAG: hypothetical protein ACO3VF_10550, partial [Tamlana sp.]
PATLFELEAFHIVPVYPEIMEIAVIYEANIRQYLTEVTFNSFEIMPWSYKVLIKQNQKL